MKNMGTMKDTPEAITDFNHQFSISILVKKRVQENFAVVSTGFTSQAIGEETETIKYSIIEATAPSTRQAIGEDTVAGDNTQPPFEHEEGYEFNRFFKGAVWFYGVVTAVQEE